MTVGGDMGFHHGGPVIITRALANRLFPNGHALGAADRMRIRPVVGHLMQSYYGQHSKNLDYSMLFPGVARRWPVPIFAVRVIAPDVKGICKSLKTVIQRDLGADMLPGYDLQCDTVSSLRDGMLAPRCGCCPASP